MSSNIVTLVLSCFIVMNVNAQEKNVTKISYALTSGVIVPLSIKKGDILGAYAYMGPSVSIPLSGRLCFLTGIGIEVMPKKGNYGAVAMVGADYLVLDWLGLDIAIILAHDEDQSLKKATFYLSVGTGISFFLENGVSISPIITYDHSIDHLGDSISTSLFVSIPIP
jgi:hypothetical protein